MSYIELGAEGQGGSGGAVDSVNGQTGAVVLPSAITVSTNSMSASGLTSATWADIGTASVSITTTQANALLQISGSFWVDNSGDTAKVFSVGVSIDGVDYGLVSVRNTAVNDGVPVTINFQFIQVTPKTLTIKPRYIVNAGGGGSWRTFDSSEAGVTDSSNIKTFRVVQWG